MAFKNLQFSLRNGVDLRSKLLLATISAHTSRASLQFITKHVLDQAAEQEETIWISCRSTLTGQPISCGFRLDQIHSDKQTFIEMLSRDSYAVSGEASYDLVIDAGANGGLFSILADQLWPRARLVLFEPSPSNRKFLDAHMARNQCRAERRYTCIGDAEGEVRFYVRESNRCSLDATDDYTLVVNARVEKLSNFLVHHTEARILLKLDVEGAELAVLEDILPLRLNRLRIVGELHDRQAQQGRFEELMRKFTKTFRYLEDNGDCVLFSIAQDHI